MALSSIFQSTTPLSPGQSFPLTQTWEDVINYTKFYIQIKTDKPCIITVYQCNAQSSPSITNATSQLFVYQNVNSVLIFEGNIVSNRISFVLLNNSSSAETTLYYSVLYK